MINKTARDKILHTKAATVRIGTANKDI